MVHDFSFICFGISHTERSVSAGIRQDSGRSIPHSTTLNFQEVEQKEIFTVSTSNSILKQIKCIYLYLYQLYKIFPILCQFTDYWGLAIHLRKLAYGSHCFKKLNGFQIDHHGWNVEEHVKLREWWPHFTIIQRW